MADPHDTANMIEALREPPRAMALSHDRLILQRAMAENTLGLEIVLVRCPHTVGLCFEYYEAALDQKCLAMLPCPCNDRSEVIGNVELHI